MIKFSGYSVKDVQNIKMKDGDTETESFIADNVSEDSLSEISAANKSIVYHAAGFVSKNLIEHTKCMQCENYYN